MKCPHMIDKTEMLCGAGILPRSLLVRSVELAPPFFRSLRPSIFSRLVKTLKRRICPALFARWEACVGLAAAQAGPAAGVIAGAVAAVAYWCYLDDIQADDRISHEVALSPDGTTFEITVQIIDTNGEVQETSCISVPVNPQPSLPGAPGTFPIPAPIITQKTWRPADCVLKGRPSLS